MTPKRRIEIIGIHRLQVTKDLFERQFEGMFGHDVSAAVRKETEDGCRHHLESVVLVEAFVHNRDAGFDVGDFTQPVAGEPESSWQAAYEERFLTADGKRLAVPRGDDCPTKGDLRIAFFMHEWQPKTPLKTSYGDVPCPPPSDMPERLAQLVPYLPID